MKSKNYESVLGFRLICIIRTTNVSFLVGLRKFFCIKVAFIAPREVSRL